MTYNNEEVDDTIKSIINDALSYSGRFQYVKSQPITELQLYRVINGVDVDNKRFITKYDYDENKQFEKIGSKTFREWYNEYLRQFYEMIDNTPTNVKKYIIPLVNMNENVFGYKSIDKLKTLQTHYNQQYYEPPKRITNYFPLKYNIKRFQLHKVRGRNCYLIDLMKTGPFYYLLAINVNTRFLFSEPTNYELDENDDDGIVYVSNSAKNAEICASTMIKLIKNGWNPKYIESDGESSFNSDYVKRIVYETYHIQYRAVRRNYKTQYPEFMTDEYQKWNNKTEPIHSSLSIIDRVTRTIRDIAYNLKIGIISPQAMKRIVDIYNNAPHKTLSKYAEFIVTPSMVQNDKKLESYIVRKIMQHNYTILNDLEFKLEKGTRVKIYNDKNPLTKRRTIIRPGSFIIDGFEKGLYKVKNKNNGEILYIPRYKLCKV